MRLAWTGAPIFSSSSHPTSQSGFSSIAQKEAEIRGKHRTRWFRRVLRPSRLFIPGLPDHRLAGFSDDPRFDTHSHLPVPQ